MRPPPADSTIAARTAARRFLADIREHATSVGDPGNVGVSELARRVGEEAARKSRDWPTRSGRHRFLVELAGEARNEWMVQLDAAGSAAAFYDALHKRLGELAETERD